MNKPILAIIIVLSLLLCFMIHYCITMIRDESNEIVVNNSTSEKLATEKLDNTSPSKEGNEDIGTESTERIVCEEGTTEVISTPDTEPTIPTSSTTAIETQPGEEKPADTEPVVTQPSDEVGPFLGPETSED